MVLMDWNWELMFFSIMIMIIFTSLSLIIDYNIDDIFTNSSLSIIHDIHIHIYIYI